jgi:glycerate kinase
MASASGLALLAVQERDVMHASSFGTGILIKDALLRGAKKIILGIGGSATNDGGVGMAEALGYQFFDHSKNHIHPTAELMTSIDCILKPIDSLFHGVEFIVACDVENPLLGPTGASHVYGPQKGATPAQVERLELGLKHLDGLFQKYFGLSVSHRTGAGAAGGMGAGCMVFLNAKLISGVEFIAREIGLEDLLSTADVIITGEGLVDEQSVSGKVVGYIASLAAKHHKKIQVICGACALSEQKREELGVEKLSTLVSFSSSREEAIKNPDKYIPLALHSLFS